MIATISNVEVQNIQSAGFIQLQTKWLQHLDEMLLRTNILLQKLKQNHLYLHVSVGRGVGYFLKRLHFLMDLLENFDR